MWCMWFVAGNLELALRGGFNEMDDIFFRIARRRPRDYSYASVRARALGHLVPCQPPSLGCVVLDSARATSLSRLCMG
jgi:hypothetical protein